MLFLLGIVVWVLKGFFEPSTAKLKAERDKLQAVVDTLEERVAATGDVVDQYVLERAREDLSTAQSKYVNSLPSPHRGPDIESGM